MVTPEREEVMDYEQYQAQRVRHWVGVDLGQAYDYTAVCLLEVGPPITPGLLQRAWDKVRALDLDPREALTEEGPPDSLRVGRFLRPELGTPYDRIAAGILKRIKNLKLLDPNEPVGLALDCTGVGRGVRDTFRTMIREDRELPRI